MKILHAPKRIPVAYRKKSLIVFDLDGTLAESKSPLKADMAKALVLLLQKKKVAVIGGGTYEQFQNQFLKSFNCPTNLLHRIFLFPTTSTSFYRYDHGWKNIYRKALKEGEKRKIMKAFEEAFEITRYQHPKKLWGKVIEDRGTQITFSALGQKASVAAKTEWAEKRDVRPALMKAMRKRIPEFEIRSGGLTSIDVTRKGIDKAYGIRQIKKTLHIPISSMLFIGDALYPGGNDRAAKRSGIITIPVSGPNETMRIIGELIKE
jgi:HAD superfamily hydrolase (TIGR01484 family)